jgi:hypothetical protein
MGIAARARGASHSGERGYGANPYLTYFVD